MATIRIMFSRFSAFYSPLICTIAAGYLREEGLDAEYGVATPDRSAGDAVADGSYQVTQYAVSASWAGLEAGRSSSLVHFAQINLMDGFFIAGKNPDPGFTWDKLSGKRVLVDHGAQPMAMFKYGLHRMGVDFDSIDAVDMGGSDAMEAAFRARRADYVHLQGPAPQQLEKDGAGHIVASVGEAVGPVAFSSLAATRDWLATDMAQAFMRAYRKARAFVIETPAAEIAKIEQDFFPNTDQEVLAKTIAFYQGLGNWHPSVEISRESYETALDVFEHSGLITRRHAYDDVCSAPPDA